MPVPMGTFHVEATVSNLHDRSRSRTLSLLVDTGSTYTTLPREVLDALAVSPLGTRRVRLASGRVEEWPLGSVLLRLEDQELPTTCLFGPAGARPSWAPSRSRSSPSASTPSASV